MRIDGNTTAPAAQTAALETADKAKTENKEGMEVVVEVAKKAKSIFDGGFLKDYMEKATKVEAQITAEQEQRVENGLPANKLTEIMTRMKYTPEMLGFVLKRAVIPIAKLLV